MRANRNSVKTSQGFTLIEILIAILVLAIGLLGALSLLMVSVSGTQEGYFQSQGSAIAEDLASRIRANRTMATPDVASGSTGMAEYVDLYLGAPYDCDAPPAAFCRADATNALAECTPQQLVDFDRWEVCNVAATQLPQGQVYVANDSGNRLTIGVSWLPNAARQDAGEQEIRNPTCAAIGVPVAANCVIIELTP